MPDTGMFFLYEVRCQRSIDSAGHHTVVKRVQAQCNGCRRAFKAESPPTLQNIAQGGAVLTCPACERRQAISIARFEEFVARFASSASENDGCFGASSGIREQSFP